MGAASPLLTRGHEWTWFQHEVWRSVHLLVVVGIVATGVVVFLLALRHLTRRGRGGRVFLDPTGYPLAVLPWGLA